MYVQARDIIGDAVHLTNSPDEDLLRRLAQAEAELARMRRELSGWVERVRDLQNLTRENLQVASSIIGIKAARWSTSEAKQIARNMRTRLDAVGTVFARPDPIGVGGLVDLSDCMGRIAREIDATYGGQPGIGVRNRMVKVQVRERPAISLALIAAELIANAFQHAFIGRFFGTVEIGLERLDRSRARFWVADNGVGLPREVRANWPVGGQQNRFSGLRIAYELAREIGGDLARESVPGCRMVVTFPAQ